MCRASYCNVYINQRDAQILVNNLYFLVKWLYTFRTIISPSSGAIFNKLYSAIGTSNVAPDDGLMIVRNMESHFMLVYTHASFALSSYNFVSHEEALLNCSLLKA